MHMNMIVWSIEVINNHNAFVMWWFKSAIVILCLDLHIYVFLGYYLAIQLQLKLLSIKCDDRLLDDFYYGYFMLEQEDLTIIWQWAQSNKRLHGQ